MGHRERKQLCISLCRLTVASTRVDAFASEATAMLARYWTKTKVPGAEGTDRGWKRDFWGHTMA